MPRGRAVLPSSWDSRAAALDRKSGLGLAALPRHLADGEPSLSRLVPPLPELAGTLWILTHKDSRHVARVRAILDAMADGLAGEMRVSDGSDVR